MNSRCHLEVERRDSRKGTTMQEQQSSAPPKSDLELQRRLEELAAENRRLEEFLPFLAHELRNRLGPLRQGLYVLRMPNATIASTERVLQMMDQQIVKLTQLADEVVNASRNARTDSTQPREINPPA